MIANQKSETKNAGNSLVPPSWKLCALVFKAIAEGHLSELESQVLPSSEEDILNGSIQDETFSDAVLGLYIELCEDVRRALPTEIRSLDNPRHLLEELREIAQSIIDEYNKALPKIDGTRDYAEYLETIVENCRIIVELLSSKTNEEDGDVWHDSKPQPSCFSHAEMRLWYKIINGNCIEEIDYDDFYHVLECTGEIAWFPKEEETEANGVSFFKVIIDEDGNEGNMAQKDYESVQIKPLSGYGMALYTFELLLVVNRRRVLEEIPNYDVDDDGEMYVSDFTTYDINSDWDDKFKKRIAWDENYNVREDSWKTGYFSSDERPSFFGSDVTKEDRDLLKCLCQRFTFEDIASSDSLPSVLGGAIFTTLGYEQYKFIHDNLKNLEKLHRLLIQELEYLYDNGDDIADCFEDKHIAERSHDEYSKFRYELKQDSNETINNIYTKSLTERDFSTIHRILFSRRFYAYEYLWQQPVIFSEMVKEYLQKCVVQDETLLLAVKRSLEDSPLQRSLSKMASGKVGRNLRVEEAIQVLREEGVIDEQSNILPIVPGGKKYKTLDLIRILVGARPSGQKEFARPKGGWKDFITRQKTETVPANLIGRDGKFIEDFYGELWRFDLDFINGIDWNLFNGVFTLKGKPLSGDDLCNVFKNKKEYRTKVIEPLIRKYENETDDSFVRIRK